MRRIPKLALSMTLLLLSQMGAATAHKLPIGDADRAVTRVIRLVAEGAGYDSAWADDCSRESPHRVACMARTRDWVPSLGATANCRRGALALYRDDSAKKIAVRLSKTVKCRYNYPTPPAECSDDADNDADGKIDYPADPDCTSPDDDSESAPLPAPDTQITDGPPDGATLQGVAFPDGTTIAFVNFGLSAVGGVDPFFECSVDGGAFTFCGTGTSWSTPIVFDGVGAHSFGARACSGWGSSSPVCDLTPETRSYQVVASTL